MKRKTAVAGLSYLAGMFFVSFLPFNAALITLSLIIFLTSFVFLFDFRCKKQVAVALVSVAVGISVYLLFWVFDYSKTVEFDGKEARFSGEITDFSYIGSDTMVVTAKGKANGKNMKTTVFVPYKDCSYCDEITFDAKFKKITNSIAFNSADYSFSDGIFVAAQNPVNIKITDGGFSIVGKIKEFSDFVKYKIRRELPGDEGGFLSAMLCGDTSILSDSTKSSLNRLGIGHILSVSGTHLIIISYVFGYILKGFSLSKKMNLAVIEIIIIAFAVFSGMSPSVLRAAVMMSIVNLTKVLNRIPDSLTSMSACGVLLTLVSPEIIRSASFLLSMSGVFAVSYVTPIVLKSVGGYKKPNAVTASIVVSFCVWAVSLPFVTMFFNSVSVVTPAANLILAPFCTMALILSAVSVIFICSSGIFSLFIQVAGLLISPVLKAADFLSESPYLTLPLGYDLVRIAVAVSVLAAIVIILIKRNGTSAAVGISLVIAVFFVSSLTASVLNRDTLEIYTINYENSEIIVLNKNRKAVIIDSDGKNADVCARLLEYKGVVEVKAVFLYENYYSGSARYNAQIDFCKNSTETHYRLKEIESYDFENVNIVFSDNSLTVFYDDCEIRFDRSFANTNNKIGEIHEFTLKDGEISDKGRFNYAFG